MSVERLNWYAARCDRCGHRTEPYAQAHWWPLPSDWSLSQTRANPRNVATAETILCPACMGHRDGE